MERNVPRSQPVQAMKTTPFSPACQQSPGDHVSPKARGDLLTLAPRARSGSPLPSLLSWKQHQPRGLPRSHRLPSPHLTELSWCTPPPRAIPGRYPVPSFCLFPPPAPAPPTAPGARAQTPRHLARPLRAPPLPVPRPSLGGEAGPGRERARRRGQWALGLLWPLPRAAANRGGRWW